MTVKDICEKCNAIQSNIGYLHRKLPDPCFPGQEPLCDTIKLLEEYIELLSKLEVKVQGGLIHMNEGTINRCVRMALEVFDYDKQDLILMEEMSELTKELIKRRRGKDNMDGIVEEMTHVYVSLGVVKHILGIPESALEAEARKKLEKYGWVEKED